MSNIYKSAYEVDGWQPFASSSPTEIQLSYHSIRFYPRQIYLPDFPGKGKGSTSGWMFSGFLPVIGFFPGHPFLIGFFPGHPFLVFYFLFPLLADRLVFMMESMLATFLFLF